ncbi:MAG TPA: GNAT family N-acetyltransferase [Pseudonocardiaceae bacterium]|nr:GNAT family N-acetyltransferase [Pseudonocardiaceae bacterium]
MTGEVVFRRVDDELGEFALRQMDPEGDLELLHSWVTAEKSVYWMMQGFSREQVLAEYRKIGASPVHDAFLGLYQGVPAFLVERYDPFGELGDLYAYRSGDVGMHFLTAPSDTPVHGFSHAVITTVMELLFADPAVQRVVVEPDVRNTAVHALNALVGFRGIGTISLPDKDAFLSICTRAQYEAKES